MDWTAFWIIVIFIGIMTLTGFGVVLMASPAYGELQCIDFKKDFIHIHATPVTLDGKFPPGNIGIVYNEEGKVSCYKEIHTHFQDGWLHLESNNMNRTFTMGEFLEEWGLGIANRTVTINGLPATFDTALKDRDKVVICSVN